MYPMLASTILLLTIPSTRRKDQLQIISTSLLNYFYDFWKYFVRIASIGMIPLGFSCDGMVSQDVLWLGFMKGMSIYLYVRLESLM